VGKRTNRFEPNPSKSMSLAAANHVCLVSPVLPRCGYGTSTRYRYRFGVQHFLKKLMYVYGHKLRYIYVPGTDRGTYPELSLKWSTRAS
jgi:hypothetical protein